MLLSSFFLFFCLFVLDMYSQQDGIFSDENLLWFYENFIHYTPIEFVLILFLCVSLYWIIYIICYVNDDNIETTNKCQCTTMKIYPNKTIIFNV